MAHVSHPGSVRVLAATMSAQPSTPSDLHVLLVGEHVDASGVRASLDRSDRHVQLSVVRDGADLRDAFTAQPWDAVVCDGVAPATSGEEVLTLRRELGLDTPIVVVAAGADGGAALLALRSGAADFVREDELHRLPLVIERQQAERRHRDSLREARREAEHRYTRLFDAGIASVVVAELDGPIVEANDFFLASVGYTREELRAGDLTWLKLTPSAWLPASLAAVAELRATGRARGFEKAYLHKDGTQTPVLMAATLLDDGRALSVGIDLSAQMRVDAVLEERATAANLCAEVAVLLTGDRDLPSLLTACAEQIVARLHVPRVRVFARSVESSALQVEATACQNPHAKQEPGLLVPSVELPLRCDGDLVGLIALDVPAPLGEITMDAMRTLSVAMALRVRSKLSEMQRSALEGQLQQAQKMEAMGRLAGGVAHDFNNLLSVVQVSAETLLSELLPADPLREEAEAILLASTRAAELTRQLLTFSRHRTSAPEVLDLDEVLTEMEKMLRRLIGTDVAVSIRRRAADASVRMDQGAMQQVIMNLAVNARDAMAHGGTLIIETSTTSHDDAYGRLHLGAPPGEYVLLSVRDSGCGMDAATQARIFEPFFTTKDPGKGTGLGLSTVFGIVQRSGGHLTVDSTPGAGTTFVVHLPRAEGTPEPRRDAPERSALRGSETVLLVEDDEHVRATVRGTLRRHGYQVIEARDPLEALALFEVHAGSLDLLLTDVVMPHMSGTELARRLLARRPSLKVLCMSGYTGSNLLADASSSGAFAYVQKPFTIEQLARALRAVLAAADRAR